METWSKNEFDGQQRHTTLWLSQTNKVPAAGSVDCPQEYAGMVQTAMDLANNRKEMTQKWFEKTREDHVRLVCEIVGMSVMGDFPGTRNKITKGPQMAKSLEEDPSEENIKRMCFVLYYSAGGVYKHTLGLEMTWACESIFMQEHGIQYGDGISDEGCENKDMGCVSSLMGRMLNTYRCNVKEILITNNSCVIGSVRTNAPPKGEYAGESKKSMTVFWVGLKKVTSEVLAKMSKDNKKKQKLDWSYVSVGCAVMEVFKGCNQCAHPEPYPLCLL